ncbi:IclR family transcriptional regulator [Nocardioides nitrophenolicus]|uniref:IclR family transcriptional regulator n=1 Tax=Nocardioides nitrophenolicus TaxID=60489 RepID=UPI00195C8178|nr:IclR family transcriptional regulator [Nocardioides nitrophenolicus]MBM7519632.1 DNA-binding IclR family transcriptional regulator [Nocardioides nitrophenolicus]
MSTSGGVLERADRERAEERPLSMVERMTTIMVAFGGPSARLSLEDVQEATGLPRSTAHRILNQLIALDWVRHTPAGYALGSRALGLGGSDSPEMDLRAAAAETLRSLHLETGLVVHLGVLEGADVRILDKLGGAFAARVPTRVGVRLPAARALVGRAQLAFLPPEDVDALVAAQQAHAPDRPRVDLAALHRELGRVRARAGVVLDRGRNHLRLGCVAAPIIGRDGPCGGISLVGGAQIDVDKLAPVVVRATRVIAHRLATFR